MLTSMLDTNVVLDNIAHVISVIFNKKLLNKHTLHKLLLHCAKIYLVVKESYCIFQFKIKWSEEISF